MKYWKALVSCCINFSDFIESPESATVPINSTVWMRCKPNETDLFGWLFNNEQLLLDNLPVHITCDNNLNVLTIVAAKELNGSVFQCVARRNSKPVHSEEAYLIVTGIYLVFMHTVCQQMPILEILINILLCTCFTKYNPERLFLNSAHKHMQNMLSS